MSLTQKSDNWRTWETDDRGKPYGEMFFRRAKGTMPEMECSKAAARRLAAVLKPGERLLDVGCGAGNYYRSLSV